MSVGSRYVLVISLAVVYAPLPPAAQAAPVTRIERVVALPVPPPNPAPAPDHTAAMIAAAEAAAPDRMTLGVAVLDLAAGTVVQRGAGEFYSASLSKLMLVVDMLDRDVELSDGDRSLINRALSSSDDNAMNVLWGRFDGPAAMTRVGSALGMAGTETPDDPSQWGETEVSPGGYARLFQHIVTEMDPADRAVIVDALSAAPPEAADGFDQFFGLLAQPGEHYAKQGWMYWGSRLYLHSAGVLKVGGRDYVVVLMSVQPATASAPAALSAVAGALLGAVNS